MVKPRGPKRDGKKKGFYKRKARKSCEFCIDKNTGPDYKSVELLHKYVNERGKIRPRRATGCCARHQRKVTTAIKRAREMALLAYSRD